MNLLDLPDEMLLSILTRFHPVDALCTLSHLHPRLDRLVFDPLSVRELDFTTTPSHHTPRSLENILPHINDKVTKLILTPHAMEQVLGPVHYPRLSSLSLTNIPQEQLLEHLKGTILFRINFTHIDDIAGNAALRRLLTRQITQLSIRVDDLNEEPEKLNPELSVFESVLSLCKGVTDLTYVHWVIRHTPTPPTLFPSSSSCTYPALTKLNIHVYSFDECLRLLDGRFESLSDFSVYVTRIKMLRTENLDCTVSSPTTKGSTREPSLTLETIAKAQTVLADLRLHDALLR